MTAQPQHQLNDARRHLCTLQAERQWRLSRVSVAHTTMETMAQRAQAAAGSRIAEVYARDQARAAQVHARSVQELDEHDAAILSALCRVAGLEALKERIG